MRTDISSEDEFQSVLVDILEVRAHVQRHNYSAEPGVPDLSFAYTGDDYWLELKYGVFKLGREKYDRFHFGQTTRGQLEWLKERAEHGSAECGILAFWKTGDSGWLSYIPPERYLSEIWNDTGWTAGSAILADWTVKADHIRSAGDLQAFIQKARRAWLRNAGSVSR